MRVNNHFRLVLSAAVLSGLLLSACGRGGDDDSGLPSDVSSSLGSSLKPNPSDDEIKAAIPKILKGLDDIKQEIKSLRLSGINTKPSTGGTTTKPGTTPKPSTGGTTTPKPSTGGTTTPSTTPSTTPKPPAASANDELKKVLDLIANAPFVQATIEKTEKSFTDGHVTQGKLIMYTKQPNLVKIDAVYSSTGSSGAKVLYTSGVGTKVKVRPGGALSFVTTELDKHDDKIDSTNRYTLDSLDLFGLVQRLSDGYTAELVGKTTLAGVEIHVLKLKTSGTNSLDSRIVHEYIGYEPSTHKVRLWECYAAGSADPYMRVTMTKLEFPANIPDSTFKL
ncbi:MAG: outer membrane lipoprotein carrier protein LolA [Candidatus Sericytochromatia bacterium]